VIKAKDVRKKGHSPMAAARKHAKFLRDHMGMDFIAANAEVIEVLRAARDDALAEWDHNDTAAMAIHEHTSVHVHVNKDGQMSVEFSFPTTHATEALHEH